MEEKFLKFGGVEFVPKASAQEINAYVDRMSEEQRESLYEVAKALLDAGLIEVPPDAEFSTIDEEFLRLQNMSEEQIHSHPYSDLCPACKSGLRFSGDVRDGELIECGECGADLTVVKDGDRLDLRLSSEVDDES